MTPDDETLVLKYRPYIDYDVDLTGEHPNGWHCGATKPSFCSSGSDPNTALANWLVAIRKWERHPEHGYPAWVLRCKLCEEIR